MSMYKIYSSPLPGWSICWAIRSIGPHYVYLAYEHCTPYCHGDGNDGKIDPRKVKTFYTDMLPCKDITPEQASQGCAKGRAESAVVDAKCHCVHSCPKSAFTNWISTTLLVYEDP